MTYTQFYNQWHSLGCFSIHQVHAIIPTFNRSNLHQWQRAGYIVPLRQGWYAFADYIQQDLLAAGIPDSVIYLDYAGFRTYDSMVRAKEVFGLTYFTIISQPFHNERALYIATRKGLDVVAFNAPDVQLHRWQIRMTVREWLARTKAVLDIYTGKQPHFLGEPITIE